MVGILGPTYQLGTRESPKKWLNTQTQRVSGSLEKESLPESLEERGGEGANGVITRLQALT